MLGVLYAGLVTVGGTVGSGPWEQSEEARAGKHSSVMGSGDWDNSTTSLLQALSK